MTQIVEIHEGKIRLPTEWLERHSYPRQLLIEELGAQLLIRPVSLQSGDAVFCSKLKMSVEPTSEEVKLERSDLFL